MLSGVLSMSTHVFERTPTRPSIAYDHRDGDEAILFVHGLGADRRTWRRQMAGLSSACRPCALDLRGYLDSEDGIGLTMDDFVTDVLAVMDALGVERAHLAGQSMGGLVLQHLWMRAPERVRSLTLVTTTRSLRASMTDQQLDDFISSRRDLLATGISMADLARTMAAAVVGPEAGDDIFAEVRDGFAALRPQSYLAAMEVVTRYCPIADLGSIDVPVLVVSGRHDLLTPPAAGKALAAAIPDARYVELPDAGHMLHLERASAFNRLLEDFLEGSA
jgi:3-oxoadipate enol-lactonase